MQGPWGVVEGPQGVMDRGTGPVMARHSDLGASSRCDMEWDTAETAPLRPQTD